MRTKYVNIKPADRIARKDTDMSHCSQNHLSMQSNSTFLFSSKLAEFVGESIVYMIQQSPQARAEIAAAEQKMYTVQSLHFKLFSAPVSSTFGSKKDPWVGEVVVACDQFYSGALLIITTLWRMTIASSAIEANWKKPSAYLLQSAVRKKIPIILTFSINSQQSRYSQLPLSFRQIFNCYSVFQ